MYCLDFFDVVERAPVNTPNGYVISYYPHPGVFTFSGGLVSWETAAGMDRISADMEKYSTPEGSQLVRTRPGKLADYEFVWAEVLQKVDQGSVERST